MRHSRGLIALGASLLLATSLQPAHALPLAANNPVTAETTRPDVMQVDFLSRLLSDGKRKPASTHRRASRSSQSRRPAVTPAPVPALSSVPIPIPRPETQTAQAATSPVTEDTAAPSEARTSDAATPAAPARTEPAPHSPAAEAPAIETPPASPVPTVTQPKTASEPMHQAEVPTPLAKPLGADAAHAEGTKRPESDKANAASDPAKPQDTGQRDKSQQDTDEQNKEQQEAEKPAPPPPPPLVHEDPAELKACIAELTSLGAKFAPTDPIDEGDGCGIEHPVDVDEVLPGISLGGATMRCQTALSMAHWLKDTVQPALKVAKPDRSIVRITPGSTYACRLRNSASTGKISEHARGNAFDVAAFRFDNGEVLEMKPRADDHTMEGALQKTVTAGACLHFTTVLAPGSDASHETHLHLDIIERKGGYRICESP